MTRRDVCHVCMNSHTRPLCWPSRVTSSGVGDYVRDWYWWVRRAGWRA